ncbi:MAG: Cytosine/purine/uracil/thiamine/allantoin permease family protein [uncultured Nocardioidaceae bacterium]|uniref:Cytosine/purine/uracil/thiamine/allantoin permease family protein n=1 Tax=uncultured Nocardioidaceae bacterium TaxID=253824 RepID=A0A6J4ME27_9ACTN|nr:MAG: Cytosine/purine/uracil/thiamine/allantoin permease family protein [uncultured Nocardioidaceae bacterium]
MADEQQYDVGRGGTPAIRRPKATEVEQHGIDTIPPEHRHSRPLDLFRIQFGGANTFATIILGTFPVLLGLSFWQAVAATVTGVVVGALVLMPMGLFGPLTGTNNAVSSGAHFGVRGRIVGSFLSLLTAIAFYSISVWVSGDAFVGALVRLVGVQDSELLRGVVYAVIGALVIVVVVYGYLFMLLVNKIVVVGNTVLILLGVLAYAGDFDPGYTSPTGYALGTFWPTFVLSALIVMGNPVSFGAFLGDWSRYIPRATPARRLLGATLGAQLMTLVPFLFGVATATLVAGEADYVVALINASPLWYALLLMVVAFLGGLSTGITSLYGTGLDFSSVFPRLSRVQASLFIGALAFVFILVGRLAFDLVASVNAFIGAIVICTTPWMIIMTIGYVVRRGHYDEVDLQVFNQGRTGGKYWASAGVNWRGMVAWVPAAVLGLLFANYPPLIEGPFRNVAGGVDLSLVVALGTAAVVYLGMLFAFPEPRYLFGPQGPRFVPAGDGEEPPVVDNHSASAHRVRSTTIRGGS